MHIEGTKAILVVVCWPIVLCNYILMLKYEVFAPYRFGVDRTKSVNVSFNIMIYKCTESKHLKLIESRAARLLQRSAGFVYEWLVAIGSAIHV